MHETSRFAFGLTWREYAPSRSVTAPVVEFATMTPAPGMGAPLWSVTLPVTRMVCAKAKTGSIRPTATKASIFFRLKRIVLKFKS